jgi:hypothetical protein
VRGRVRGENNKSAVIHLKAKIPTWWIFDRLHNPKIVSYEGYMTGVKRIVGR